MKIRRNKAHASKIKDRINIERGTVLAIPLREGAWALGQVIHPGVNFYMGVGQKEFVEPLSSKDIDGMKLSLFSWTNDAELFKNRWRNLGVFNIQEYGPLPEYKLGAPGEEIVESFFGSKVRDYDPSRDENLGFRTIRSPLLFQDAVQAAFGIGEWKPSYDLMKG